MPRERERAGGVDSGVVGGEIWERSRGNENCLWVARLCAFNSRVLISSRSYGGGSCGCCGRVTTKQSLHSNAALFVFASCRETATAGIPAAGSEGGLLARGKKTQKGWKSRKSLKTANLRKLVRGNSQQVTVKKKNVIKTFLPPPRLLEIVLRASKRVCLMNRNRKKQQPRCQRPHLDSGL